MTIKETIFQPLIFPQKSDIPSVYRAIRGYTDTPLINFYREPGEYPLFDPRWNKVTHRWNLTVRTDGTGILRIEPTVKNAAIAQLGIPGEFLKVTTILQSKSSAAVLMGSHYTVGGVRNAIFKMLEYEKE